MRFIVADHERRIGDLERSYSALEGKIQTVENGQLRLENTVMGANSEQKDLMNLMIKSQFEFRDKRLSSKEKIHLALISGVVTVIGGGGAVIVIQNVFHLWR